MAKLQDGLTCEELRELVTDYLEDALAIRHRTRFEAHVSDCASCEKTLDEMRVAVDVLSRLPRETLSQDMKRKLIRSFQQWRRRRH